MPRTTVRPGHVIRDVLKGELPLVRQVGTALVNEAVSQASASEMARAYREQVALANSRSVDGQGGQKGMGYCSFYKRVKEAFALGLISVVGEGDPLPPLVMIRDNAVIPSREVFYALTPAGEAAATEWDNMGKALAERGPGVVPPERRSISPFLYPGRFTVSSVPRLTDWLARLIAWADEADWPGEEWPEMATEVGRFAEAAQGWLDAAQETLETEEARDNPRAARLEALQDRVDALETLHDALESEDLSSAMDALSDLG